MHFWKYDFILFIFFAYVLKYYNHHKMWFGPVDLARNCERAIRPISYTIAKLPVTCEVAWKRTRRIRKWLLDGRAEWNRVECNFASKKKDWITSAKLSRNRKKKDPPCADEFAKHHSGLPGTRRMVAARWKIQFCTFKNSSRQCFSYLAP